MSEREFVVYVSFYFQGWIFFFFNNIVYGEEGKKHGHERNLMYNEELGRKGEPTNVSSSSKAVLFISYGKYLKSTSRGNADPLMKYLHSFRLPLQRTIELSKLPWYKIFFISPIPLRK